MGLSAPGPLRSQLALMSHLEKLGVNQLSPRSFKRRNLLRRASLAPALFAAQGPSQG
jgi:hypothetical protein